MMLISCSFVAVLAVEAVLPGHICFIALDRRMLMRISRSSIQIRRIVVGPIHEVIHSSRSSACCDVCSGIPADLLLLLLPKSGTVLRQKRRTAQRHVDSDLEKELNQRLLEERDTYTQEHPHYLMIGSAPKLQLMTFVKMLDLSHLKKTLLLPP